MVFKHILTNLRHRLDMRWFDYQNGRLGAALRSARDIVIALSQFLHRRSRKLIAVLDVRMEQLIVAWICVTVLLGMVKVCISPLPWTSAVDGVSMILPYLLIAIAPVAGYRVAAGSFPRGLLSAQPSVRLARYGSWKQINLVAARQNPAFGPSGFMASLLVGILLNVPFRTFEFILAMPAVAPTAPSWAHHLLLAMMIDVVVMNFFYMVCFVLALRSVPLFPRMLLFAWAADLALQLIIAQWAAIHADLPATVGNALGSLLQGNIDKVLISAVVWLPYLILSERVNVTFRQRIRV